MTRTTTRAVLAVLVLALAPLDAEAQTIQVQLWDREYDDSERDDLDAGVNLHECEMDYILNFRYDYSGSLGAGKFYVYIGSGCDDKEVRDRGDCYEAVAGVDLQNRAYVEIHPTWIVDPQGEPPSCIEAEGTNDVFFLVLAEDADQSIVAQATLSVGYDTDPPDPPVDIASQYGERSVRVNWDVSDPDYPEEWNWFYVLCWPGDGTDPLPDDGGSDASTDTSTDTADDTSTDTASDVPLDTEPDPDAGADPDADATDADADLDVPEDVPDDTSADTTSTDTGSADTGSADTSSGDGSGSEECPSGGFEEGDTFSEAWACSNRLGSSTRTYRLGNLDNGQPYKVSVVALDTYANPSVVAEISCSTPSEVDDFWEHYKGQGGSAEKGFCFVATATYGDYEHPAVVQLRALRDEVIEPLPGGAAIVRAYYAQSPPAARWIERHPRARAIARLGLWPVAGCSWALVSVKREPGLALALVLGFAACMLAIGTSGFAGRRGSGS